MSGQAQATRRDGGAPPVVAARSIEKWYGGVHALRGVDFDLYPGEVHALLGQNGSGKSTLIKAICGDVQPTHGTLSLGGEQVVLSGPKDAMRAGVAVVGQELPLVPALSVAENMAMGAFPRRRGLIGW